MFLGTSTLANQELGPQNDSFVYNVLGGSWMKLHQALDPGHSPTPRSHMAGFKRDGFVVYGGLDSNGKALGDLWHATIIR